jgi:hypothetical protein
MSPDEFRACLAAIGWTQRSLAERLDIHHTRTARMATGRYQVPPEVAAWLRLLAQLHAVHKLPFGWRADPPADAPG